MILGIMGAMPDEVDQLCARLENVTVEPYGGVEYHKGTLAGKQVVVCCAGMGKANAAATTQVLITKFGAEKIIFSGIAGNMTSKIGIGDVVIGKTVLYHDAQLDMICQNPPFLKEYTGDPALIASAEKACADAGVKMGLELRVIPLGHDVTAVIHVVTVAIRAALIFGNVQPGDLAGLLKYTKERVPAFVNTFGAIDNVVVSAGAGAIALGFPVVVDIDLGEIKAEAGKDGAYSVDVIKDGFHVVTITDENGEVAGKTTFSVSVSDTATETTVIKLDDGSQIAVVPKGTNTLWLDFVVNDDGTITIVPGTSVEEPTNEVPVTKPSDSGNPIINNPVISKTGELIRENPLAAAAVFLCGLSLIFFIILRKKRKDDEEEENTKPVC